MLRERGGFIPIRELPAKPVYGRIFTGVDADHHEVDVIIEPTGLFGLGIPLFRGIATGPVEKPLKRITLTSLKKPKKMYDPFAEAPADFIVKGLRVSISLFTPKPVPEEDV